MLPCFAVSSVRKFDARTLMVSVALAPAVNLFRKL